MTANIYQLAEEFKKLDIAKYKLDELDADEIERLYTLVNEEKKFRQYNKLAFWEPYPFQLQWIEASKHYHQRYLSAGNR